MQSTAISVLSLLLLLFSVNDSGNSDTLDLTTVEQIRVLLFEDENPEIIRINAVDFPIEFYANGQSHILNPTDGFAFVQVEPDGLILQTANSTITSSRIDIKSGGGLTQFFITGIGNRMYHGNFEIKKGEDYRNAEIINSVNLEKYVSSVIGGEMNFKEIEALKSQAVISRTYALWSIHNSPYLHFHLKDNEQNQVYRGALISRPDYEEAAIATSGEILTWSGKLILAAYSSTCGGSTSNNEHVWSGNALPYLRSTQDRNMCSVSPHFDWEYSLDEDELYNLILSRYGFRYQFYSTELDPGGRIESVIFTNRSGNTLTFNGNEFRLLLNRTFGDIGLKSTRFVMAKSEGKIQFIGNGLGHGVGLCQWGAKGFSESGWRYDDILSFYFSGTKIVDLRTIENQTIALSR